VIVNRLHSLVFCYCRDPRAEWSAN